MWMVNHIGAFRDFIAASHPSPSLTSHDESRPSMKSPRSLRLHIPILTAFAGFCINSTAHAAPPTVSSAQDKLAAMSVPFVPNAGQWDKRAAFAAQTFAGTLFVTTEGQIVYSLPGKPILDGAEDSTLSSTSLSKRLRSNAKRRMAVDAEAEIARTAGWALSETLVGIHGEPRSMRQSSVSAPAGYRPMPGNVSYVVGNNTSRHSYNLNTYERVNLGDMYPGINVQLRATGNNVEKIFTVAPQQDPNQIQIKLAGANQLEIGSSGELIVHTDNGSVTFTAPIAFQETASGERTSVQVAYALDATNSRYGFTLGKYDRSQALVIDPLLQSTYLGGTANDSAAALAIHPTTGDVYVAGGTTSMDFPDVTSGAQSTPSSNGDGFIARFNAALTVRLQSTYYGGTGSDGIKNLAIHPTTGDIYASGSTLSADLPGAAGGAQSTYGGVANVNDAFLVRFNSALTSLQQTTYIGSQRYDYVDALAIHPTTGDIYVAGTTQWTPWADPIGLTGGAQSAYGGGNLDAFVMRFNASLTTRLQSSYIGGTGDEEATSLAIHLATGDVYVAGRTGSTDFPGTAGGAQSAVGRSFITRFNAALTTRSQSTYHGGTGNDSIEALAIHRTSGDVYVAGTTSSTDLPGVAGGAQSTHGGGGDDAFVTRFNAALTARLQSSYLGGTGVDQAYLIAIHPATGEVYVAGNTIATNFSGTIDFPGTLGGAQSSSGGGGDAFVTRFNAALTSVLQSTFYGGATSDPSVALAIHPTSGDIYVAGRADGGNFELPGMAGGAQSVYGGGSNDGWITRISRDLAGTPVTPPVIPVIQPVPTLSTYAMGLLILLLLWITTPLGLPRQRHSWGGKK